MTLRLQGQDAKGRGTVIEDDRGVAESLAGYFQQAPQYARYFGVALDPNGQPKPEDLARVAQTRVVIQVKLER